MKLRRWVWVLVCAFAAISAGAQTANVVYNFQNFQGAPQKIRELDITPIFQFTTSFTNFITRDMVPTKTGTNGSVTVTNMLMGYGYLVSFIGANSITTFTNMFGTNLSGTINASDYANNIPTNMVAGATAYSQAQADALFIKQSGGSFQALGGGFMSLTNGAYFETNTVNGAWMKVSTNGNMVAVNEWGARFEKGTNFLFMSLTNGQIIAWTNGVIYNSGNITGGPTNQINALIAGALQTNKASVGFVKVYRTGMQTNIYPNLDAYGLAGVLPGDSVVIDSASAFTNQFIASNLAGIYGVNGACLMNYSTNVGSGGGIAVGIVQYNTPFYGLTVSNVNGAVFDQGGIGIDDRNNAYGGTNYCYTFKCSVYGDPDGFYYHNQNITNYFEVTADYAYSETMWDNFCLDGPSKNTINNGYFWSHGNTHFANGYPRGFETTGATNTFNNDIFRGDGNTTNAQSSCFAHTASLGKGTNYFNGGSAIPTTLNTNGFGFDIQSASYVLMDNLRIKTDQLDTNLLGLYGIKAGNGARLFLHSVKVFEGQTNFQLSLVGTAVCLYEGGNLGNTNRISGNSTLLKWGGDSIGTAAGMVPNIFATNYYGSLNTATNLNGLILTNSQNFSVGAVYTGPSQGGLLVGSAVFNDALGVNGSITLFYTNNAIGYQQLMSGSAGATLTNSIPFCIPLSTNATFQFVLIGAGYITNTLIWNRP